MGRGERIWVIAYQPVAQVKYEIYLEELSLIAVNISVPVSCLDHSVLKISL